MLGRNKQIKIKANRVKEITSKLKVTHEEIGELKALSHSLADICLCHIEYEERSNIDEPNT